MLKKTEGLTQVQVSYEYIGLTEKGRNFVDAFAHDE